MQRRKVLLPEPELPMIAMTSPAAAVRDTPFRTSSAPKLLWMSSTTSAGGVDPAGCSDIRPSSSAYPLWMEPK